MNTALHRIQREVLLGLLQASPPASVCLLDGFTLIMRLLRLRPGLSVWLIAELLPLQLGFLLGRNGRSIARSLLREHEAAACHDI